MRERRYQAMTVECPECGAASEVEASINGHEVPFYVECTTRARKPALFWRVTLAGREDARS